MSDTCPNGGRSQIDDRRRPCSAVVELETNSTPDTLPPTFSAPITKSHLERLRLGTPYPKQLEYLEGIMAGRPLYAPRSRLLVDYTDVIRPGFYMFGQRAVLRHAQGVVITCGHEASATRKGWSVPKANWSASYRCCSMRTIYASPQGCKTPPCWCASYRTSACDLPATATRPSAPAKGRTMT